MSKNTKLTDAELSSVRERFFTLQDDLVKAGLRDSQGRMAKQKVVKYLLARTGATDVQSISKVEWENFFQHTDGLRFDLPRLAQYIEILSAPPSFSVSDLEMLKDMCVSPEDDLREWVKYWKPQQSA